TRPMSPASAEGDVRIAWALVSKLARSFPATAICTTFSAASANPALSRSCSRRSRGLPPGGRGSSAGGSTYMAAAPSGGTARDWMTSSKGPCIATPSPLCPRTEEPCRGLTLTDEHVHGLLGSRVFLLFVFFFFRRRFVNAL